MKRLMRGLAAALYLGVVFGPSANGQTQAQSSETATVLTEDVAGVPGEGDKVVVRTVKEVSSTNRKVTDSDPFTVLTEDVVGSQTPHDDLIITRVGRATSTDPKDPWSDAAANAFSSIGFYRMKPDVRAHLKLPKDRGLIVARVAPNSPESRMGLRESDIILTLGDVSIASPADLLGTLKRFDDKPMPLVLLRKGETVTIQVQPVKQYGLSPVLPEQTVYAIGVTTAPVDPLLRRQLKLPEGQALAIRHIDEKGPANKVKLAIGDILLAINGKPVGNEASLSKLIQENGAKPAELKIIHEGEQTSIKVTPEPRKLNIVLRDGVEAIGVFTHEAASRRKEGTPLVLTFEKGNSSLMAAPIGRVDPRRDGSGHRITDAMTLNLHSPTIARTTARSQPSQASAESDAVAKKLGEMSAQIDSLRKSIEELARSIKDKK